MAPISNRIEIIVINSSLIYGANEKTVVKSKLPKVQKIVHKPILNPQSPILLVTKALIAALLACSLVNQKLINR